jgi:hypothetical protein
MRGATRRAFWTRALRFAGGAVLAHGASGARAADPNPDATIEIEETRIGIGPLSGTIGGGRLRFRGEEHRFTSRGLASGGIGVSSLQAQGEVFNLRRLEQFPGVYTQTAADDFEDETGRLTVLFLRNEQGVRLRLRATRSGIVLSIPRDGMTVSWRE